MTRGRSSIALLVALIALLAMPAGALASGGVSVHGDPAASLPTELITRPVAQSRMTSLRPGVIVDNERSGGLPETFCGIERTDDNTVDAVASPTDQQFKLIYAYASDQPDRFDQLKDKLQASASLLARYMAGQSGGAKTIRFDLGTNCGPQYVDIQVVALPQPQSYYVDGGAPIFSRLEADVRAGAGITPGSRRNLLVYADALRGNDGVSGSGARINAAGSDAPGAGNPHNDGDLMSVVWGPSTAPAGTYAEPATMMHELAHNLGAVQASAPHTTDPINGGHCTDEQDVMCYADGGPNNTLTYTCDFRTGQDIDETLDCGRDDYFNPAPALGSYLDTHWNVYDSEFLASCAESDAVLACGNADTTNPVNTTPAPATSWYTAPYQVALSGTDTESGVDHMEWILDGGPTNTTGNGDTITISASGTHTLQTRAVDEAGNASDWRNDTVKVDVTKPSDLTASGGLGWHDDVVDVQLLGSDAHSGVDHLEWRLDGGPAHSAANATTIQVAADGNHTLSVRGYDVAGNVGDWSDHTIRVDTVLPTDETAAPSGWQTAPLPVTVTGSDAHSGVADVTYRVDGGAPTTVAAPATVTISANGEHTLETYVADNAGNRSAWKATTVRIDTGAPDNTTVVDGSWRSTPLSVLVVGADGVSGVKEVQWRVDGGAVSAGASNHSLHVAGDGDHLVETRVVDNAGNMSGWKQDHVRIDSIPPANTTPMPAATVGTPYSVAITGTDALAAIDHVEWAIDPAGATPAPGEIVIGDDGDEAVVTDAGPHELLTRVVDRAGNASSWRTDAFTIDPALNGDTTPPVDHTTLDASGWTAQTVKVTVDGTDDHVNDTGVDYIEVRRGGSPVRYQPGQVIEISDEGQFLVETRVFDNAGNHTDWRRQWARIDKTNPVDATTVPAGWSNTNTITLSGSDARSGLDRLEYSLDGGATFVTAASGDTVNLGGDGTYTILTRAVDRAENATDPVERTIRVDRALPVNTSAVPATGWLATALSLDLTGTDAGSGLDTMQWRLDNGAVQDGGPAVVDTDGVHTLETRALDLAGNGSVWRSDTVRVDLTAPENTTPAPAAGWRRVTYSVHVEGDDGDGSGIASYEVEVDGAPNATGQDVTVSGDGVHTIKSRIVDNVGHTSAWREDTVKIDSVVPTATLTCAASTAWNARAVACTPVANGGPSGLATLTLARNGGAPAAVTSGRAVSIAADGSHTLTLKAVDGAGNQKVVTAHVKVDRTGPAVTLGCAAASTPTGYVCRTSGSDGLSGLAALYYSVNGGAWTAVPASRTFAVASGTVRVLARDAAGNQALTAPVTLTSRKKPVAPDPITVRSSSKPVYLAGHKDADSLVGALLAARSPTGTVSIDLRPLAVGRGTFKVQIKLASGKRNRTVTKTYKVGRGGTLPRIAASLSRATAKATVRLTVSKRSGRSWKRYATSKIVLAK